MFPGDFPRTFHEVVAEGVVKPTGNKLTLQATDNDGAIAVSDIVLLHREQ